MKFIIYSLAFIAFFSLTRADAKSSVMNGEIVNASSGTFNVDTRQSTVSRIGFSVSSNGTLFNSDAKGSYGLVYPKNSYNQYIYGGGLMFLGKKRHNGNIVTFSQNSFDPNSGKSMFVPGRIEDGNEYTEELDDKYKVYMSTNFSLSTGESLLPNFRYNWSLWYVRHDASIEKKGDYVFEQSDRNSQKYPTTPAIVSEQDFFCVYKDTDLRSYPFDSAYISNSGMPLGIQYEQSVYSGSNNNLKDAIIIRYKLINTSADTLFDCIAAPVFDPDIASIENLWLGVNNDRCSTETFELNEERFPFCYCWTHTDAGESDMNFGYVGFTLLETPAVGTGNFVMNNKIEYRRNEQSGLSSIYSFDIDEDIYDSGILYANLGSGKNKLINEPAEQRFAMPVNKFNLLPGDTARLAILIAFAQPAISKEATGNKLDIAILEANLKKGVMEYDGFFDPIAGLRNNADEKSGFSFVISPNPVGNELNMTLYSLAQGIFSIRIYDITGKTSADLGAFQINEGTNNLRIALNLPQSLYYLSVSSNNQTLTRFFIKSK